MAGLVGGPVGGAPPRTPENFRKFFKKYFLRILQKMHYFSIFSKKFNKPCVNFLRVWTKNAKCRAILRNFRKFSKISLENFEKSIILACFSKNLTSHALLLSAFGRKLQIVGKFSETFGNFWWKFNRKFEFLSIFGKSCC